MPNDKTKPTQRKMPPSMQAAVIRGLIRDLSEARETMAEHSAGYAMADRRVAELQAALNLARSGRY